MKAQQEREKMDKFGLFHKEIIFIVFSLGLLCSSVCEQELVTTCLHVYSFIM